MKKKFLIFLFLTPPFFLFSQIENSITKNIFFKNGLIAKEFWFNYNKKTDSLKTYYKTGKINEIFYYDDNEMFNGTCRQFTSEGKLKTTWLFEHGKLIKRTDYILEYNIKNQTKVEETLAQITDSNNKLKENPNDLSLLYKRANARKILKNYILAEDDFIKLKNILEKPTVNKTGEQNKRLANTYDNLASIYKHYDIENQAIHYQILAINENPTDIRLTYNLGSYLHEINQNRLAVHFLKEILKKSPDNTFANWALAGSYLDLDQYELALKHINIAFLKEENIYKFGSGTEENDLKTIRGLSYHKLGKTQLGLTDLNDALQINPKNSTANKYLGIIYSDLGQNTRACGYFQKAKQLGYEQKYYPKNVEEFIEKTCNVNKVNSAKSTNQSLESNSIYITTKDLPYILTNTIADSTETLKSSSFNYEIYDIESNLIHQENSANKTIEIKDLPVGLYILIIKKENETKTFKLINNNQNSIKNQSNQE